MAWIERMSVVMVTFGVDPGNWQELGLRLGLAMIWGGAIGWNRQQRHRSAGLRTHMLVSVGAAIFVLLPLQMNDKAGLDGLTRVAQGVATGIGFLGAGEILQVSRKAGEIKITGLTSAASLWVTAAIGLVAGCGLWQLGGLATGLTLLILGGVKTFEDWFSDRTKP